MNKEENKKIIELIKTADLSVLSRDQLITILNLFDVLNVPMILKEEE